MREKKLRYGILFKMMIMACMLTLLSGVLAGCGEKTEDTLGNNEDVMQEVTNEDEEQPTVDVEPSEEQEVEEPEVVKPEPSEEPEPTIDVNIDTRIDNEALAIWLATTEAPDIFEVYIWDAESETAIKVENAEYYTITKDDELVIMNDESLFPFVIGRDEFPYVFCGEYYIYKLNDISEETYMYIELSEYDSSQNMYINVGNEIEFYVQPYQIVLPSSPDNK